MMNDGLNADLAELWQNQDEHWSLGSAETLIASLRDQQRSERRQLFRLNVQEVGPSVVLFLLFGAMGMRADAGRAAFLASAFLCLGVGMFLAGSSLRLRRIEQRFDSSLRGELQRSLSQVQHRFWLHNNVGLWYLLPLLVAVGLVFGTTRGWADGRWSTFDSVYSIGVLVLYGVLFLTNRRLASSRYQPLVDRHSRLLAELDERV